MKIGDTLNYFGNKVIVIETNQTHVLIQFESGTKICTNKFTFSK
jgi:hypothetical protein